MVHQLVLGDIWQEVAVYQNLNVAVSIKSKWWLEKVGVPNKKKFDEWGVPTEMEDLKYLIIFEFLIKAFIRS